MTKPDQNLFNWIVANSQQLTNKELKEIGYEIIKKLSKKNNISFKEYNKIFKEYHEINTKN